MNITDVDDKIIKGAAAAGEPIGDADRPLHRAVPGRRRRAADDDAGRRCRGRPSTSTRWSRSSSTLLEKRPRLPDRRRLDLLPDRVVAGVRPAGPPRPRAAAGRRAGRGRRVRQGRRPRLRPLEGPEAGRAVVGHRDRGGPAGLAHRVLGDEHGPPRPVVRHPHRRRRPRSSRTTRTRSPRARPPPAQPFVRTWLHCAHLQMGGAKMAKSTGNIARVGRPPRPPASRRAPCATRSSRSTTGRASTTRDESLAAAGAAVDRLDAVLAALDAYREDGAGRRAPRRGARAGPDRRSRPPSTTTSTSRPRWRRCSTWSATSTGGSTRAASRPPTPAGPSRRSPTSTRSWRIVPDAADDLEPELPRRCSTHARRRARHATGPLRPAPRRAGGAGRARRGHEATASAGAGPRRRSVPDRKPRSGSGGSRRPGRSEAEPVGRLVAGQGPVGPVAVRRAAAPDEPSARDRRAVTDPADHDRPGQRGSGPRSSVPAATHGQLRSPRAGARPGGAPGGAGPERRPEDAFGRGPRPFTPASVEGPTGHRTARRGGRPRWRAARRTVPGRGSRVQRESGEQGDAPRSFGPRPSRFDRPGPPREQGFAPRRPAPDEPFEPGPGQAASGYRPRPWPGRPAGTRQERGGRPGRPPARPARSSAAAAASGRDDDARPDFAPADRGPPGGPAAAVRAARPATGRPVAPGPGARTVRLAARTGGRSAADRSRTRSSSPAAARSKRPSSPAARRIGCSSRRSAGRRSRSSCSTPRACASRSSRSRAAR